MCATLRKGISKIGDAHMLGMPRKETLSVYMTHIKVEHPSSIHLVFHTTYID